MLVLTNLLVIATAVVLGLLASHVAGDVVEQRLVRQTVSQTVAFFRKRNIPFDDPLMRYLREMFGVEFVAVRADNGQLVAGTFPPGMHPARPAGRATLEPPPPAAYDAVQSGEPHRERFAHHAGHRRRSVDLFGV
ncbi:MAG: hypothetical protein KGY99_10225 [Phycisphaerae bacterium]|nr:hypothetical protein [Phycisphaerae bacterium]